METIELLQELATKPSEEIQYAIVELMLKGKIEFKNVNAAYIKLLEIKTKQQKEEIHNVNALLVDFLIYRDKVEKHTIDEALKSINKSKMFNTYALNKKYEFEPKDE